MFSLRFHSVWLRRKQKRIWYIQ